MNTWKLDTSLGTCLDVNNNDEVFARVWKNSQCKLQVINRFNGNIIRDFPSQCNHPHCRIRNFPIDSNFLLEVCENCSAFRSYDINTGAHIVIHEGIKILAICVTQDSIVTLEKNLLIKRSIWKPTEKEFIETSAIKIDTQKEIRRFAYEAKNDFLIISFRGDDHDTQAVELKTGTPRWSLSGRIEEKVINPIAITCDGKGHVYAGDFDNNRLLVIDGLKGKVMEILDLRENLGSIHHVRWSENSPEITLFHDKPELFTVSCYSL